MSSTPLETPDTDAPLPEVGPSEPPGRPSPATVTCGSSEFIRAIVKPAAMSAGTTTAATRSRRRLRGPPGGSDGPTQVALR